MNSFIDQGRSVVAPLYWRLVDMIYATGQDADGWPELLATLAHYVQQAPGDDAQDQLVLHLEQALALNTALRATDDATMAMESSMSAVSFPFLILDDRRRIHFHSERFSELRHSGHSLQIDDSGVRLANPEDDARLGQVVTGQRRSAVFPGLAVGHPTSASFTLIAFRLQAGNDNAPGNDADPQVLLAWFEPNDPARGRVQDVARLYDLTQAETTLLEAVLRQESYADLAERRGVSTNTVRTQIRQVLAKTGARSKAEVLQLVQCGPELLSRLAGDRNQRYVNGSVDDPRHNQLVELSTGDRLGFAEFGDSTGTPVVLLHNVSGSRFQIPVPEAMIQNQGLRLIVPDRFGVGLSDWPADHSLQAFARAMTGLLDHLGLSRVKLIGTSVGAIYALACVHYHPQRYDRLALISPMVELTSEADLEYINEDMRGLIRLARRSPLLLRLFSKLMTRGTPTRFFDRRIENLPLADQRLYIDTGFYEMSLFAMRENLRNGVDPMVNDFLHLAGTWPGELQQIEVPTQCWHGALDITSPVTAVRRFAAKLPDCELIVLPDETHMLINRHWNTIVAGLLSPGMRLAGLDESAG